MVCASAKKASVWKRRDGRGTGWNTLALCVGYHFILSFYRLSFNVARSPLRLCLTVTCMVSFGDSKHKPVKPLHRLLDVTPSKLALSAKCTIHDVTAWCSFIYVIFSFNLLLLSCLPCVGVGKLFGWFWSCGWIF